MIKNYIVVLLMLIAFSVKGQIVTIPDENFKNALLNQSPTIDLNNDSEIQVSEAIAYTHSINASFTDFESLISDFTGIEAFINITGFIAMDQYYSGNLDFSSNPELILLNVGYNSIGQINISNNTKLEILNVSGNQLNGLDVSHLADLEVLILRHTNFASIDVSQNSNLKELSFFASEISSIDLSNNLALEELHSGGAPLPFFWM